MASTHKANSNTPERAASSVPPVESFTGTGTGTGTESGSGELNVSLTLHRQQWMNIAGALSIAAGQSAIERNFEQMFVYNGICALLGQRLGVVAQTAGIGDLPPPPTTRAAAA